MKSVIGLTFLVLVILVAAVSLFCFFQARGRKERLKIIPDAPYIPGKIPHIIHQTWKNRDPPSDFKNWSGQCKKLHPTWKFILWTDEDNRNFIKNNYPNFLSTYDNYDKKIKRIDAVRYFYLYHYGGVYMDLDFTCLKNMEQLLDTRKAVFGFQLKNPAKKGAIANAFMAAPPGHPLFRKLINRLHENGNRHVLSATGPNFLTDVIKKYKGGDIMVHKMPLIYTHEWNDRGPCRSIAECKSRHPDAYTATFWAGTWLKNKN